MDDVAPRDGASPPASYSQERYWFLSELDGDSSAFNQPIAFRLRGKVDVGLLGRTVTELVRRHEALRTSLRFDRGRVLQHVHPTPAQTLSIVDAADDDMALAMVRRMIETPFDLASERLFRASLIRIPSDSFILVLVAHHGVADGRSLDLLIDELIAIFTAYSAKQEPALPEPSVTFASFARAERERFSPSAKDSGGEDAGFAYWRKQLEGAPPSIQLYEDHRRRAGERARGMMVHVPLPAGLKDAIAELARKERCTPFIVVLAAYNAYLSRHSGQNDVVVGVPASNRTQPELNAVVGSFANTLALRTKIDPASSFRRLVRDVRGTTLDAFDHQHVPLELLVQRLAPQRDGNRAPFFQASLRMAFVQPLRADSVLTKELGIELGPVSIDDLRQTTTESDSEGDELALVVYHGAGALSMTLTFDTSIFEPTTGRRIAARFAHLFAAALESPDAPLAKLALVPEEERAELLELGKGPTRAAQPDVTGVHHLFEAMALRIPNAVAVEDDRGASFTYGELSVRSERIARWLASKGVGVGSRVAVSVHRSADMLAAVLGVLRAGAAYVPIDPDFPPDRRAFMREDSKCAVEIDGDTLAMAMRHPDGAFKPPAVRGNDLAYVLYTSGSTGRPKGVMIEHACVVNFLRSMAREPGMNADDRLVAVTTLAFDIAGLELYLPLAVGARVVIASRDTAIDPQALGDLLERSGATVMQATPATWRALLANGWRPARKLKMLVGGEAVPPDLVASLGADGNEVWNMYGPTETTIWSTCTQLRPHRPVTIGRPIDNTTVQVLDAGGELAPIGVPGELYIGGEGVARGYHERSPLSAERFVPDRFSEKAGARCYRTGDAVRWRTDGKLEFMSRLDHQVKIRGYRIELGEIEATLNALPSVREAVVIAQGEGTDRRLVAYVVGARRAKLDTETLQTELRRSLPEYMVPSVFMVLQAMPLTPNGKIDKKALPAVDVASTAVYVAPRTPLEEELCAIFVEILGAKQVGIHDDFFALGGHSLLAMQVVGAIRARRGIHLRVRDFFEAATVARLAEACIASEQTSERHAPPLIERAEAPLVPAFEHDYLIGWESRRRPSPIWNHGDRYELRGPLDTERFVDAVRSTIARQDSLRYTFDRRQRWKLGTFSEADLPVEIEDASAATDEEVTGLVRAHALTPFPFQGEPLIRLKLMRRGPEHHTAVVTWHQIIHDHQDGPATHLLSEILAFYEGRELPELPVRYSDYARWSRDWFTKGNGRFDLDTTRRRFVGARAIAIADHPSDRPIGPEAFAQPFVLDSAAVANLDALCRATSSTRFMVALAALAVLLRRWSGQDDLTVMTLRNYKDQRVNLANLTGRFTSPIPVRISAAGQPTWTDLVARAKASTLDAFSELAPTPITLVYGTDSVPDHPLGRVVLNDMGAIGGPTVSHRSKALHVQRQQVRTDFGGRTTLIVGLAENTDEGSLVFVINGALDRFEQSTIKRLAHDFEQVLRGLCATDQPF